MPALEREEGRILVRSTAAVTVTVDGVVAGRAGLDPSSWASFGPYAVGSHVVGASCALGVQEKAVELVSDGQEARVEFEWGSRLVVVVSPTGIPSLTLMVDGQAYTSPVDYSAEEVRSGRRVRVEASAPGYVSWSEEVALRRGRW